MTSKENTKPPDIGQTKPTLNKARKLSLLKSREEKSVSDYARNYVLEALSIFFWLYTLIKAFVFDIDKWFISSAFPGYEWILNFRLIYILAIICIIWFWVKTREAIIWFLYISFYPLILLFIRLPHFTYKQKSWILAFSIFNGIASFFSNVRYALIFSTLFLAAFSIAVFSNSALLLALASMLLVALVIIAYVKSFLGALKPTVIFRIYSDFFKKVRKRAHTVFAVDDEFRNLPTEQLEPSQLTKWNESLQTSVLFNRLCLFASKKLRDYQRSPWQVIPSIFGLLYLIVFTVVSFSGINYALFKIDGESFRFTAEPSWFTFFYFSFNNLVLNTTAEVAPATILSQTTYMFQASLSFFLIIILATLIISHGTQKASSELDQVIEGIKSEAERMESFIQEEYRFANIDAAIERLREAQAGLIQIIYWLSKRV